MMDSQEAGRRSDAQQEVLDAIAGWFAGNRYSGSPYPLTLGGLAGTGKTTLIARLLPGILPGKRIAYAAYTGKAVSVLQSKLPGSSRVSTLHRLLYQPQVTELCSASGERLAGGSARCFMHLQAPAPCPVRKHVSYTPKSAPLAGLDLVVADEASMIPERLWQDLVSHGVPVLAVGDHGQLPPVRSSFSLMKEPDLRLEEIYRQDGEDPSGQAILLMAQWAREQGHIPPGLYGPGVVKILSHELGYAGLHPGDADMIICATNPTRQYHNAAMRTWHGRSGPPQAGDVVICLRNNYDEGLLNGLRGVILETGASSVVRGEPAIKMAISLDGLDEPWEGAVPAVQFGQRETLNDLPRGLPLFDYGYALTAHKAQGSQEDKILVIEENWPREPDMRRRWLYTAVTRASKALTVVGG